MADITLNSPIVISIAVVLVIGILGKILFDNWITFFEAYDAPALKSVGEKRVSSPKVRERVKWEGKDSSGNMITFRWNEETNFWEQLLDDKVVPNKCKFREVTNTSVCVIIQQEGASAIILTEEKASFGETGKRFASGTFPV